MLLTGLFPVACLATFLMRPRPTCLGIAPPMWACSSYIDYQSRKWSTDMPTGQSDRGTSSAKVSSSQITLVGIESTELASSSLLEQDSAWHSPSLVEPCSLILPREMKMTWILFSVALLSHKTAFSRHRRYANCSSKSREEVKGIETPVTQFRRATARSGI